MGARFTTERAADMKILTFAWVRTQTGDSEFDYETETETVGELLAELIATRPKWDTLAPREAHIRCALNQRFVERDTSLANAQEVAFFPPVTGG